MARKATSNVYDFDTGSQDPMQVNVRLDASGGSLRPVGRPQKVCDVPGSVLGVVACDGRDVIFTADDGKVYATDTSDGKTEQVMKADVDFTAAVNVSGGPLLTADLSGMSPVRINVDKSTGKAVACRLPDRRHAPRLSRVDGGVISRPLPERTLKGTYSRSSVMLHPDDLHSLTKDYSTAYCDICNLAVAAGRYVQPVIARVSALDSGGQVLFRSAPVMISPDSGAQLTQVSRQLSGAGLNIVKETMLQATPFSIGVTFPPGFASTWGDIVASVAVEVSPQIHPVNLDMLSAARIEHAGSDDAVVTLTAPGLSVTSGGIAREGSEMRRRVEAVVMNIDEAMRVARTISWNNGTTPADVTGIFRAETVGCEAETRAMGELISQAAGDSSCELPLRLLNYPHTFSAACGGVSGGKMLWGGLTARLFDGYTAAEQSVKHSSVTSPVSLTSIVTLADGRHLVNTVTDSYMILSQLSPLIVYPHPAAVKITIIADGKKWESALRPTACRSMAWCLADDLRPVTPVTDAGNTAVPAGDEVLMRMPGAVALAPVVAPLEVGAVVEVGREAVTAVTPQVRAGSSLDVRRHHFYVFTRGGISAVTAGSGSKMLAAVRLDYRPVMTGAAVTEGADGVFAVAGEDLVKVSGNKVVTLLENTGPCIAGRAGTLGEIWLVSASSDPTMVYNPATQYACYRTDVRPEELITAGERLLLRLQSGEVLDASAETAVPMTVSLTFRRSFKRAAAVKAFGLRLFSSDFKGKVILAADNGIHSPEGAYRIVDFDISGALNRPIESKVLAAKYRYVTLGVRATVSPDTRLEAAWFAT